MMLFTNLKSGIIYVVSHNYAKIKTDSYDSLPIEKILNLHNVRILIKSVFKEVIKIIITIIYS